jgi:flagellar export protein FliJ
VKKFAFRLQHVLNLREQEEELVKLHLGQASRKVEEIDLQIFLTIEQEREALGQYRNPKDMHVAQNFMIRMQKERKTLHVRRIEAEKIRQEIIVQYTIARQKAEVLRKLREKHFGQWRVDYLEQQDVQADDMAAARRLLQIRTRMGVS